MRAAEAFDLDARLLVSDIDGTLLENGQPTAGLEALRAIVEIKRPDVRFVYATGRTMKSTEALIEHGVLPKADAVVPSVGTELWMNPFRNADSEYDAFVSNGFNRERVFATAVSFLQIRPQPDEFQSPMKASFYLEDAKVVPRFEELLSRADAGGRVVYSCDRFLDVIPHRAGKRNAVNYLRRRMGILRPNVLVAGDSGNDLDMLSEPGFCSVVVGNAEKELEQIGESPSEYRSTLPHAAGVLEGAEVFDFWSKDDRRIVDHQLGGFPQTEQVNRVIAKTDAWMLE